MTASDVINYLQTIEPKTEEEQVEEIKNVIMEEDLTTVKDIKKRITEITQPYDHKKICEEILSKFGVVYKVADVKKLMNCVQLLPK